MDKLVVRTVSMHDMGTQGAGTQGVGLHGVVCTA
jgi:hypothetical protein